jgi:hypothetical protein
LLFFLYDFRDDCVKLVTVMAGAQKENKKKENEKKE